MVIIMWLLLLFSWLSPSTSRGCLGPISQSEYSSLQSLYDSTNGRNWTYSSPNSTHWYFPSPLDAPCGAGWAGLNCSAVTIAYPYNATAVNSDSCTVSALNLFDMNLQGFIPAEMAGLKNLTNLVLSRNKIIGSIPSQIQELSSLASLDLSNNVLTGKFIPTLTALSQLILLDISSNHLTGTVGAELNLLTNLKVLFIYGNYFTGAPANLSSLTSLEVLSVYENHFTGTLPNQWVSLPSLLYLAITYNMFSGSLSGNFSRPNEFQFLSIGSNLISGRIPDTVMRMSMLLEFNAEQNHLTGPIPSSVTWDRALGLYLGLNHLSGSIPDELYYGATALVYIYAEENLLSGTLSPLIAQWSHKIGFLSLDSNLLTGSLPSEIGTLTRLTSLQLATNSLDGSVPSEIEGCSRLLSLFINDNYFSGSFPDAVTRLSSLQYLYLYDNYLDGTLSESFGNMTSLKYLIIFENLFSGTMPQSVSQLILVELFEWSRNLFTGTVPDGLWSCTSLNILLMDSNYLHGTLSPSVSQLSVLSVFTASFNHFSGTIPASVLSLTLLSQFNVSTNHLSGQISASWTSAFSSLNVLDLSSNQISGTFPGKLFSSQALNSVLLYDNCLSGTLPDEICAASFLSTLILDGLSSSSSCDAKIATWLKPVIKGVFPRHLLKGSIPSCVWGMGNLTTLHMSGNGLTGELEEIPMGTRITDVSIAGNNLHGTIPLSMQLYGNFYQFDLSGNRLSGTLSQYLNVSSSNINLNLTVNRLSGDIPESIMVATDVNVLDGNLFQCEPGNMPRHDPSSNSYVCGSNDLDTALVAWVSTAVAVVICSVLAAYLSSKYGPRNSVSGGGGTMLVTGKMLCWNVIAPTFEQFGLDVDKMLPSSKQFLRRLRRLLMVFVAICVLFVVVSMSTFISLKTNPTISADYSTHTVQFLWVTTSAYLHGVAPAALVISFLSVCVFLVYFLLSPVFPRLGSSLSADQSIVSIDLRRRLLNSLVLFILQVTNMLITIVVNILYVYLLLEGIRGGNLFAVQIVMSVYKLSWSSSVMPYLFNRLKFLSRTELLLHRVFVAVFTFVVGPFVATFLSASECFRGAIQGESPVRSIFALEVFTCRINCLIDVCISECTYSGGTGIMGNVGYSSTSPAWLYSYQCSSAVLNDYVPVLVISFTFSGLFVPATLYTLVQYPDIWMHCTPSWAHRLLLQQASFVFSDNVEQQSSSSSKSSSNSVVKRLFSTTPVLVKFMLCLVVLLTFGLACPLLSVVVLVDSWTSCVLWRYLIQRYLVEHALDLTTSCSRLEQSCLNFGQGITVSLLMVFSFAVLFWTLSVFDMVGDVHGGVAGGWAVMACILTVALAFVSSYVISTRSGVDNINVQDSGIEIVSSSPIHHPENTNEIF